MVVDPFTFIHASCVRVEDHLTGLHEGEVFNKFQRPPACVKLRTRAVKHCMLQISQNLCVLLSQVNNPLLAERQPEATWAKGN